MQIDWLNISKINPCIYECGWCHRHVNTTRGWQGVTRDAFGQINQVFILVVCNCEYPTFLDLSQGIQLPGPLLGDKISKLPANIDALYSEIQRASSVNAYTLVILGCRKLLMHIAVELGAKENLKFIEYVKWFEDNHYAPPKATKWIAKIKDKGNEANHELTLYTQKDAEEILKLCQMLMKFNYEYSESEED